MCLGICNTIKSGVRQLNNWLQQTSSMTVMGEEKYLGKQAQSVPPATQTQLGFQFYSIKLDAMNILWLNIL